MSAGPEERIETLAILAGGGQLPERLARACEAQGIAPFIVAFEGQTDPSLFANRPHILTTPGSAGSILRVLRERGISDLVLIGSLRRPSFRELKPDWRSAKFFLKVGWKALGDDNLLRALRLELEEEGFRIHGAQRFASDLLCREGPLGKHRPAREDFPDIERGIAVAKALGALDVGQSVIVQEGIVLGVEGVEGTDALIRRCVPLQRKGRKGILVKLCKPGQDVDMDLPTIGPETVAVAAESGLGGIVVQAGQSLVLDPEETAARADRAGLFVTGVSS